MWLLIILAGLGLFVLWAIGQYNRLIKAHALVNEGWSGIDVQLKRRYDLIPNLVATVQGYATHEKSVFETVTKMRTAAMGATTVDSKIQAEAGLSGALKTLFAVAENYPELKANQNFQELQKELSAIENEIQLARRYYNGTARNYNILVQTVPTSIVARLMDFAKAPYFELGSAAEKEAPRVDFKS